MSEPENLNFDAGSAGGGQNTERLFGELQLEPLEVNRDELFFQAGVAVGARKHSRHRFLLIANAALIFLCVGLGALLIRQTAVNKVTQGESVAMESAPARQNSVSNLNAGDTQLQPDVRRLLQWDRLTSKGALPPGHLTAAGWQEEPLEMGSAEWGAGNESSKRQSDSDSDKWQHRPATYLDLMRMQKEG